MRDGRALVVLPTFDEAENLRPVVEGVLAAEPRADVLVVDDASPDGTGRIADDLAAERRGRVEVLHRPGKLGLASAYLEGFRRGLAAGYGWLCEMDADLSHDPAAVPLLLGEAEAGADVVLGSRYVPGGGTENWGLGRRLLSRGGAAYARAVLGLPVRDPTGGFKCFARRVLASIELGRVRSEGYAFQIELTYRALRLGFVVREIPITFVDRRVGRSKLSRRVVAEAVAMVPALRLAAARGEL